VTYELVPSTAQVMPEGQRGLRPARRTSAVMGVLAVAVIAAAGIGTLVVARDDSAADEALFVLPVPVGDWRLSDGAITEPVPEPDAPATDERFITDGSLYGVADGDGFDGLRSVAFYLRSPLPGARWKPVSTTVGDSYRRLDDSMTFAHEEHDGRWRVVSSPSDLVHAYAMLANDISYELVLVAVFDPPDTQIPDTSFVMTSPEGLTFTVETTTGSPLFDAATFAERVDPVDINGATGWIILGQEGKDATGTVVTWSPETGRTINVRSSAPRNEVVDAARRLQTVSADEWTASFPEVPRD
jgi:hypothetical protein